MSIKDQAAVVGVGATPYYKRGQSFPETEMSMACTAILRALDDAGLTVNDLDGFAIYSFACDPAEVASVLGVPEVRFAASLTSGGGGCAGALGLAAGDAGTPPQQQPRKPRCPSWSQRVLQQSFAAAVCG